MIDVCVQTKAPDKIEQVIEAAANAALSYLNKTGDITVGVVDDSEIWRLNREYRSVDRPTDVLSFPSAEGYEMCCIPDGFLGDIIISAPTALRQANEFGHPAEREFGFLTIHGTLHLLGYDHIDEQQSREMFGLQDKILEEMGLNR